MITNEIICVRFWVILIILWSFTDNYILEISISLFCFCYTLMDARALVLIFDAQCIKTIFEFVQHNI